VLADSFGVMVVHASLVPYGTILELVLGIGADWARPLSAELPRLHGGMSPRAVSRNA
jgi:hypothetical protein